MRAVGKLAGQVAQLRPVRPVWPVTEADLDRQRGARQTGTDRGGGISAGCAVGQLQGIAIGECDRDRHRSVGGYPPDDAACA